MAQLTHVQKQLELTFAGYLELDDSAQDAAMDMTVLMLRQMLRDKIGRRRRLTELKADAARTTKKSGKQADAGKARGKLVRKTNAVSPQSPITTVKTTRKNELRRT